jgi:fumarate reductase subunit D
MVHRLSGLFLTLFLPVHFWVLGRALQGEAGLESVLRWTEQPLLKFTEIAVVLMLALHLSGGLRILMLEFLPWRDWQKSLLAAAIGVSLALGLTFALNVV